MRSVMCVVVFSVVGCRLSPRVSGPPVPAPGTTARNVVLLIGDGLGPQEIGFMEASASFVAGAGPSALVEFMKGIPLGLVSTLTGPEALVAESACAASRLSTGVSCRSETLGLDREGMPVAGLLEVAKAAGRSTGIVSDTRLTHATPAAFAVHHPRRREETTIARLFLDNPPDVMLSGGRSYFTSSSGPGEAAGPEGDLLARFEERGFKVVGDRKGLGAARSPPVLGLFAPSEMPDALLMSRIRGDAGRTVPTLAEMTAEALRLLSQDREGFVLVVEAGKIDWAAHHNDAGLLLHELAQLDEALRVIMSAAAVTNDTLVVVTADHETGGFGFSYHASPAGAGGTDYVDSSVLTTLFGQRRSLSETVDEFRHLPVKERDPGTFGRLVGRDTGFPLPESGAASALRRRHDRRLRRSVPVIDDFREFYPDVDDNVPAAVARELAVGQGVVWGTGTHTSTPVVVAARGPGSHSFRGFLTLEAVGRLIRTSAGLPDARPSEPPREPGRPFSQ